ncbi:acyltransferase [Aeoliella sp. ICT_H6.2]|uniref:Acyltransferase n=1 Tax=Aeoliella straminimaris TaxID=2954799 RepID=A0A9X2F8C4_9BACT|nr:acyltransferase family protein [Aeoliella straminimaris]MCO6044222.1 acyltransferase [Aeoliella straminimaris]
MAEIRYRPEIDGLRAFAVIPVVLFHMGWSYIPGGFIGVDVFFVISGFLITSIIIKELGQGTFTFRNFWARRVRRILPAMICVTLVTLGVTYAFVFGPDQRVIGKQALASLLSVANIYFWQNAGDYWGQAAEESPFLHAWSLSVEEQFYLFFPIAVWIIFRLRSRWLQGSILTAIVASLALFLWGLQTHPEATFYLLPTRVWELGAGCLLAVLLSTRRTTLPQSDQLGTFANAGLIMVLMSYAFIPQTSGGMAVAVLGTAFILACGHSGFANALLSHPSAVHIGKLSYSLYLWHWPILVLARPLGIHWPGASDKLLIVLLMYLMSLATYHLIEKQTRRRKGMVPAIAICLLIAIGSAVPLAWTPRVYDTSEFETPHSYSYYYDLRPTQTMTPEFQLVYQGVDLPPREAPSDAFANGGIIVGAGDASPRVVVLGDSHGTMWSSAIRSVVEPLGVKTAFISMGAQSPFFTLPVTDDRPSHVLNAEEKRRYDESRIHLMEQWHPALVILCCRWSSVSEAETEDLMGVLASHADSVLLMEQPPELLDIGNRSVSQYLAFQGYRPQPATRQYWPAGNVQNVENGRHLVRSLVAKYPNCKCIPVHDVYREHSTALVLDGKDLVYVDDDHLTTFGSRLALPQLQRSITEALRDTQTLPDRSELKVLSEAF